MRVWRVCRLGVHISFVRSVNMDAWSEKQINAMRVGGNARLRDFFKQHGVTGTGSASIAQKYNTPAAAMYRDIIVALRDGKTPPTDIAPYEEEAAAEAAALATAAASRTASLGSSGGGGGGGPGAGGSGGLRMASSSSGGLGRASSTGSTGSGSGSPAISAGGATPGAPADGSETPVQRELRLREEARERLRAKFGEGGLRGQSLSSSGGGSSSGFGSSSSPAAGDDGFGIE